MKHSIWIFLLTLPFAQCKKIATEVATPTTEDASAKGSISTVEEMEDFLIALSLGEDLSRFKDDIGEVSLANNLDMQNIDWDSLKASVSSDVTQANKEVDYHLTGGLNIVFNGNGHCLENIDRVIDLDQEGICFGLFDGIDTSGVIKNLTITGDIIVNGHSKQGTAIGAFGGYVKGKIIDCTNLVNISFVGSDLANVSMRIGGMVGVLDGGSIGHEKDNYSCINKGNITLSVENNLATGANSGIHSGGIVGFVQGTEAIISNAQNSGNIKAGTGRSGGVVGSLIGGKVIKCMNDGTLIDDWENKFQNRTERYNIKRMGGIVGGSGASTFVQTCTNMGSVFSVNGSRVGGFVGHNGGYVDDCTNGGIILSDASAIGSAKHGPGWACGYSGTSSSDTFVKNCHIGGRVDNYSSFGQRAEGAALATYKDAVCHGAFDPMLNYLNNRDNDYYAWETIDSIQLAPGVSYRKYSFINFGQHIYAVEIDLDNPNVSFETAMANEICPNPNANQNANNGKNRRETLSETIIRRRAQGRNIVAGINTGFFNSHDGFPRGVHIEEGEPVFINNPDVRRRLVNHRPGFTFFTDRTISFGEREFKGTVRIGAEEFEFYSVNDTIIRLNGKVIYDANIYTNRFVKQPHVGISNPIGDRALFLVCRNQVEGLQVNVGYQTAEVVQIIDGRSAAVTAPFVSSKNDWVLQVTGSKAERMRSLLQVGSLIDVKNTLLIGSISKEIKVHNSSMFHYVQNGNYVAPSSEADALTINPTTNIGVKENGKKIVLFCVDGRSVNNRGLDFYEAYRVAAKLQLKEVIRFDGGGSTTMWAKNSGEGRIVNQVSDANGERSCMNYLHIRVK
jgi:Exopolysaccharide biosynthesis protein related to N-acetylglucosamine-1-phosphodiester alpha-N-acetylglucosaminidase